MRKIIKLIRGIKLILLNSYYYKSKLLGIKLIFSLLINSITKFTYLKFKNKNINTEFSEYIKSFKFTRNYFKHNPAIWFEIFKENSLLEKKINILEIGTFEGMSFIFFEKYLKINQIFCIDVVENNNFKINREQFNNFKFFNTTSDEFFKKNLNINFDIIYVDGSHKATDVFNDLINSHKILNNKGILIIDDFLLDIDYRRKDNGQFYNEVMGGVFMFLKKKFNYKYLYTGHQLILKKN